MEPVFMVMGQSAATAAALAIDGKTTVQNVDYAKLQTQLLKDGQVLDFESPPMSAKVSVSKEKIGGIVVDDQECERTGFTSEGHSSTPYINTGYLHDDNSDKGAQKARFTPNLPKSGMYRVSMSYSINKNRATNVPVTIHTADGYQKVIVNQQLKPTVDELFFPLGTFRFEAGKSGYVEVSNANTDGHVIIDAMQWVEISKP